MIENNRSHWSNHDDEKEENAIERMTRDMNDAQKEKFKDLLNQGLGTFVREQADIARQIIYDGEQAPLEAEYQERLAQIPNGNIVAVTRLQTEMSRKGWRSAKIQADREKANRPPTQKQRQEKDSLWEQYQQEVSAVRGNVMRVSKIQAKYRRLGLQV